MTSEAQCAKCSVPIAKRMCREEEGKSPGFCPTANKQALIKKSMAEYSKEKIHEFAHQAAVQEKEGYANREQGYARVTPAKTRLDEILDFAGRMGYKKLGLAFCMGLRAEAKTVERLFSEHDFEMVSVICKVGRVSKEILGITDEEKVAVGQFETMCNPILQAEVLNDAETEFNILLGLCVGHDSMFFRYAKAPCTVLAVKDRVTGHNPLAPVYTLDSYYRALKKETPSKA